MQSTGASSSRRTGPSDAAVNALDTLLARSPGAGGDVLLALKEISTALSERGSERLFDDHRVAAIVAANQELATITRVLLSSAQLNLGATAPSLPLDKDVEAQLKRVVEVQQRLEDEFKELKHALEKDLAQPAAGEEEAANDGLAEAAPEKKSAARAPGIDKK